MGVVLLYFHDGQKRGVELGHGQCLCHIHLRVANLLMDWRFIFSFFGITVQSLFQ